MTRARTQLMRSASSVLAAAGLLFAQPVYAEPSATQKAAAESLFQAAVQLMAEGKAHEACSKFEGSQQLEPAIGTMLRLADCYETLGKTASAWATFEQARSAAASQNRPERETIARERAQRLEARLSKLQIRVTREVPGLKVSLNGVDVPKASWDLAVPVDPGAQRLVAAAPGHHEFENVVEVPNGPASIAFEVPALTPAPHEPAAQISPASALPPTSSAAPEPPLRPERSSPLRPIGFVSGGLGLVALGVGGFFGVQAYQKNQDSLAQCRKGDPNSCSGEGTALREEARSAGTRATIAMIAGGVLVGTGITLLVIAPSSRETQATGPRIRHVSVGPGMLQLTGEL